MEERVKCKYRTRECIDEQCPHRLLHRRFTVEGVICTKWGCCVIDGEEIKVRCTREGG